MDVYNLETRTEEPMREAKIHFKHRDHDSVEEESESESSPQDMEKAWAEIDRQESETTPASVNTWEKMEIMRQVMTRKQQE